VNVLGGFFRVNGRAGIGASNLTIGSAYLDCRPIGTEVCLRASAVAFDNGSVTAITGGPRLIEFERVTFSEGSEIYTIYTGNSTRELFTGLPIIHIEFAMSLAYPISRLVVRGAGFARELPFDSDENRGFAVSVPSIGSYAIASISVNRSAPGTLFHGCSTIFSASTDGDTFYEDVGTIEDGLPCPSPTSTESFTHAHVISYGVRRNIISSYIFMFFGLPGTDY
jgi:hypothetical protein